MAKALIHNSYINEKICGSQEKTRKRKISHILETAPTHATDYDKKRLSPIFLDTSNTFSVGQNVKKKNVLLV